MRYDSESSFFDLGIFILFYQSFAWNSAYILNKTVIIVLVRHITCEKTPYRTAGICIDKMNLLHNSRFYLRHGNCTHQWSFSRQFFPINSNSEPFKLCSYWSLCLLRHRFPDITNNCRTINFFCTLTLTIRLRSTYKHSKLAYFIYFWVCQFTITIF